MVICRLVLTFGMTHLFTDFGIVKITDFLLFNKNKDATHQLISLEIYFPVVYDNIDINFLDRLLPMTPNYIVESYKTL